MLKIIKQKMCNHDFKSLNLNDEIEIGITVNWAYKTTKEFESTYICTKCEKHIKRRYIYYGGIKD